MAAWILERSILWIVAYVDALMRVRANCFPRMWSRAGAHSHSNQITRVLWQPSRNINAHTRRSNAERRDSSRRAPPLPLLFKIAPLWPQACTIRAPQQLSSEATALCDRVVVVHCDPQIIDMVHMPNGGAYAPDLMKRPQILLCARCTTLEHPPGKGQMPPPHDLRHETEPNCCARHVLDLVRASGAPLRGGAPTPRPPSAPCSMALLQ
jgi:hypothetical protein